MATPTKRASAAARARRGQSLLELVLATTIIAGTLVPAMRLLRDALGHGRDVETLKRMSVYGTSKLEEYLASTSADWQVGSTSGNFAADGYPTLAYQVVRADDSADGGIVDQLMAITTTVWDDADGDGSIDNGERSVTFRSKIANLPEYYGGT